MFYTKQQVLKHNTINDCWVICNNNVYDITDFLKKHPVGYNIILKKAGSDITIDINFHSKNAKKILKQYHIGYVKSNIFKNFINRLLN